jgi:DNA-binding transcriptional LysR family regulator
MNLNKLKTFLEVYRQGAMGKAAISLNLTQPAVSSQIAALEHEFGTPLFRRSKSGVIPTALAEGLVKDIAKPLDEIDCFLSNRLRTSSAISGNLNLAAPAELFSLLGPQLMKRFMSSPLTVQMHLGSKKFIYETLMDGRVDLALTASKPIDKRLGVVEVSKEELMLVAHPELGAKIKGRKMDASLLLSHPFIAYDQDLALINKYFENEFHSRCEGKPIFIIPDLRTISLVCRSVTTWTVLPDYLISGFLKDKSLITFPTKKPIINVLNLVWRREALRTPRVAFAKEIILEAI